jgi:hypothetical protein
VTGRRGGGTIIAPLGEMPRSGRGGKIKMEILILQRCDGKPQKCAKLMALGPSSRRLVGNKAINLDFWAPFL